MKASELHQAWTARDRPWLTRKQFSFRLPLHVAAQLAALAEMYPQQRRHQLIGDLLTAALEEFEETLPHTIDSLLTSQGAAEPLERSVARQGAALYLGGVRAQYRALANKHYRRLEGESGLASRHALFRAQAMSGEDLA